ncbi:MAG: hypothetical protein HOF43_06115, partial [Chloroflexi bacterium]|nr:hypothetical protein [Chloroflexota bacterium]
MATTASFHATGEDLAAQIETIASGAVIGSGTYDVSISSDQVLPVMAGLKNAGYEMLIAVTGVDYVGYFEMVYHLLSLSQN